jgi:hypothetical protein
MYLFTMLRGKKKKLKDSLDEMVKHQICILLLFSKKTPNNLFIGYENCKVELVPNPLNVLNV